jgi:hypothetical protein
MKGVTKRLTNLGFTLELTEDAKSFLADKGYESTVWRKTATSCDTKIP